MPHHQAPVTAGNGFATTGFVLGLVGLVVAVIPFLGLVALALVVPGLAFAGAGLARASRRQMPRPRAAAAGLTLSGLALAACLVWLAGIAHDLGDTGGLATVSYQVTGTASPATIAYSAFGDGGSATNQETVGALPWSKEIHLNGALKGSSLIATTGANGGSVTCTVIVDGKQTRKSTASGPFAVASCSGF